MLKAEIINCKKDAFLNFYRRDDGSWDRSTEVYKRFIEGKEPVNEDRLVE